MRVLVIEDDSAMAGYLERGLRESGYAVDVAADGPSGLHQARSESYDAVLLDVMLPGLDGLSLVRRLRDEGSPTPVLMLTARDTVTDRVKGLDAGADDYLQKPFSFAELLARLRALLRRGSAAAGPTELAEGDLKMDLVRHAVFRGEQNLDLTPKEFALLEYLLRNKGQVLTRTMILEHVWDIHFDPGSNVVDVHVRRLRQKVDEGHWAPLLQTVRGIGYVLKRP